MQYLHSSTKLIFGSFRRMSDIIKSNMSSRAINMRYLTQDEAVNLDRELFNEYAFSVDQLMELAGLGVATAVAKTYPVANHDKPLICCGPGNNGGDGLVCARHLKMFGFEPVVICPKPDNGTLYRNLLTQCHKFDIPVHNELSEHNESNLIIDAVFGFSFKPPNRSPDLAKLLNSMHDLGQTIPIVSIDIPSGWHVDDGPPTEAGQIDATTRLPSIAPDCLISLTAPKKCALLFRGRFHYLSGRFCPINIQKKYSLNLPKYHGAEGVVLL